MSILRSLAILILTLLLLPWGAYSAAYPAPAGAAATGLALAEDGDGASSVAAAKDGTVRVAPAPRRCRTAILTGAPCGGDGALLARAPWPATGAPRDAGLVPAGCWGAGLSPETDPDPPRSC